VAELHQSAISDLARVVTTHEDRLDRVEIDDGAIQEDLRGIRAELKAIREKLDSNGKN